MKIGTYPFLFEQDSKLSVIFDCEERYRMYLDLNCSLGIYTPFGRGMLDATLFGLRDAPSEQLLHVGPRLHVWLVPFGHWATVKFLISSIWFWRILSCVVSRTILNNSYKCKTMQRKFFSNFYQKILWKMLLISEKFLYCSHDLAFANMLQNK